MFFEDKRVLVTGGAGFIGSSLTIRLIREGAKVTVLDAMLPACGANLFNLAPVMDSITLNVSDLRDRNSLDYLVKGQDIVFNLAGKTGHMESMEKPFEDLGSNLLGQLNLLEACRHGNQGVLIVNASTRQIYGAPRYLPVDEQHPINPPDVNAINKHAAEQYFTLYNKVHGVRSTTLRLSNVYGPRQFIRNATQGFIGWFVNRTLTGNDIELFGAGEQIRDFPYIDDVVEAFMAAAQCAECAGKIYNISGERASLKKVAYKLMELGRGKDLVRIVPFPSDRKKIDIGDYYGSSKSFTETTGWTCGVALDDGLARTVDYFIAHKERYLS